MNQPTRSFTLIELLVVIVIIGILASVIVISTSSSIGKASNSKMVSELSNLNKALDNTYYLGNTSYPKVTPQGSICIEDNTNNSSFLQNTGLTVVPVNPEYKTTPTADTALTTNSCYLYFSDGTNYSIRTKLPQNQGYLIQESRHPQTKEIQKKCDPNWIPFGNRCIMKYEAKNVGGVATSQAEGAPWVNINQDNAKAACAKIGAHLLTNAEWMALARDIEDNSVNWQGTVLNRGHSDNAPANSLAASTDNDPYSGTGQTTGEQKRTHKLSNGQTIWDFASNVYEWVDKTIPSQLNMEPSKSPFGTGEIKSITNWGNTGLSYFEVGAKDNNLDGAKGIGRILYSSSDNTPRAFIRGGVWGNISYAGVFALYLYNSPSSSYSGIGFRCAR